MVDFAAGFDLYQVADEAEALGFDVEGAAGFGDEGHVGAGIPTVLVSGRQAAARLLDEMAPDIGLRGNRGGD
jgi:hypothetical protein